MYKIVYLKALIFFLFFSCITSIQAQNDSIKADSNLYNLKSSKISPDGKWVLIGKTTVDKRDKAQLLYINTQTKDKVELSHLNGIHQNLLFNDLVVGKENNIVKVVDLKHKESPLLFDNVTKYDTKAERNKNLLITLTNSKTLSITELKSNSPVLSIDNVNSYSLNPDKTKLVYQLNNTDKTLGVVDLKDFKNTLLASLNEPVGKIYWNNDQQIFALLDASNRIQLYDTNTMGSKRFQLPQSTLEQFELHFFANNDLFIRFNIKTDKQIKESEYLDIWNGNSKFLNRSNFKQKYELEYKALVYKYDTQKVMELKRTREHDYQFINIPNHILSFSHFENEDFTSVDPNIKYSLQSLETGDIKFQTTLRSTVSIIPSKTSKYILYKTSNYLQNWNIYNIEKNTTYNLKTNSTAQFTPIWSEDSKYIFFLKENNIHQYDLENNKIQALTDFKEKHTLLMLYTFKTFSKPSKFIETNKPILFTSKTSKGKALYSIEDNQVKMLYNSKNNITNIESSFSNVVGNKTQKIVFTEEDFTLPAQIKLVNNNKVSTLFKSDIPKQLYSWRKKKTITFSDSQNNQLGGTLYYPKKYDPSKKFPMIVYIYGKDNTDIQTFELPHTENSLGFNIPLLNQQDYFVFYMQTIVTNQGPGLAALDCVVKGVEAVSKQENTIDINKLGLIGHSFGGYKTSFIATQTNLFSAIVSGGAPHDFIGGFTYRYSNYRSTLDWFMAENGQFGFNQSFGENPQKYLDNSPILHAHQVKTPILLWTGLLDENVQWENTQKMFVALKRYNIPTIALFYNDAGHALDIYNKKQSKDLTVRTLDWFDYYLKDNRNIPWITKGVDYNTYSWHQLDNF